MWAEVNLISQRKSLHVRGEKNWDGDFFVIIKIGPEMGATFLNFKTE